METIIGGEEDRPRLAYRTTSGRGEAYQGDSLFLLNEILKPESVDLVVTSPPFSLAKRKGYANEHKSRDGGEAWLKWFSDFVPAFARVLKPNGSLVIDIGGSYVEGRPQRSLYQFRLALLLSDTFEMCQDFFWYNPAKLPSPVQWVNVERIRAKDSVNIVYWFAKDATKTKADNRRVLKRYSESMESLIRNGYQGGRRPSGHDISRKFGTRRDGAIPSNLLGFAGEEAEMEQGALDGAAFATWFPNLLSIANTNSMDRYLRALRERQLKPHPARFPMGLPAFFIEFLTEPGDLVCDPFAGSNTTGEAAEVLGRNWVSCDLDREGTRTGTYVRASALRFEPGTVEYTPEFRELVNGDYRPKAKMVAGVEPVEAADLRAAARHADTFTTQVSEAQPALPLE